MSITARDRALFSEAPRSSPSMSATVQVVEAVSGAQKKEFIRFQYRLYKSDPNFVPPLIIERQDFHNPSKNPFFSGARVKYFLARANGVTVGRIATCVYFAHNEAHNEKVGFFGFFDTIDDYEVAAALLKVALITLKQEGMTAMRGPANFSVNHELGFLVEGYDSPPVVMMTYNYPYQPLLAERFGLRKRMDLLAWKITRDVPVPPRMLALAEKIASRGRITVRSLDMRRFDEEVAAIHDLYNRAWVHNWGAVAMKREEFFHMAKDMKQILDPELALIAEVDGVAVGFALSIPDINQALIHLRGRLLPFGIFQLLWHTKVRKTIRGIRTLAMGVVPEYQKRGVDSLLILRTFQNGIRAGYEYSELSWVLETNTLMNSIAQNLGATAYKTYRVMEMPI